MRGLVAKRVSARAAKPVAVQPPAKRPSPMSPPVPEYGAEVEAHRRRIHLRAWQEAAVCSFLNERGEAYSVEVAPVLSLRVEAAGVLLRSMEKYGLLVSVHRKSPISGQGRRYYKVAP
jgi:hypothetical protein